MHQTRILPLIRKIRGHKCAEVCDQVQAKVINAHLTFESCHIRTIEAGRVSNKLPNKLLYPTYLPVTSRIF